MSYADFKNGLQSFNEYVKSENQSLNLAGSYDNAVARVEIGPNMKQMICDLLAGKFPPRLPQIQFCLDVNLGIVQGLAAGVHLGLASALGACREGLQAFNEHTGLTSTLGRLNAIIGEAASVASMINVCNNPINPVPIPNLIEQMMGSFLGNGEAILNKLGRIIPDRANICYDPATGKISTDAYIDGGLLQEIKDALEASFDLSTYSAIVDAWIADLYSIRDDFAYIISIENDAAAAAVEAQGLGETVDTVTTLADNAPVVSVRNPMKNQTVQPKTVTKVNKYTNYPNETTTTVYTIPISIKFTERMDPKTITGRTATSSGLGNGTYGTIVIGDHVGNECIWSVGPMRVDKNYTTFKGLVQVPSAAMPSGNNTTMLSLYVGTNGRDNNNNEHLVIPTSESGKEQPSSDHITENFNISAPVAATASSNIIGLGVPGDMQLGIPEYTSISEPTSDLVNLFAIFKQLAGYPVQKTDGTVSPTIFNSLLDDASVDTLAQGEQYASAIYNTVPVYDYCGNVTGYTTAFTQGSLPEDTPTTVAAMATNLLTPPVVTTTSPSTGASGVFIDTSIIITFSQEMDATTFTSGDIRTTWKMNKVYALNDTVEYLGVHYSSNSNNNTRNVPLGSASWTQESAAQTGAGTGTVRFKKGTTYQTGFSMSYSTGNRQLTISPSANLTANTGYTVEIIGTSTSTPAGVSPVENTSGVPMANTFTFSFTTSTTGDTQSSSVVVSASGGTVGLPSYTKAQLALLSVTASDAGSMAWCSDANGGASTAVYNGTKWVKVSDGTDV